MSDEEAMRAKASLRFVTPDFFKTLSIPLLEGRDVSDADTRTSPFVALVSESFVRRYWPSQDPIGRHLEYRVFRSNGGGSRRRHLRSRIGAA